MRKIGYIFFRCVVALFSLIPFWLLYIFSDVIARLLYYVFGYRKNVIRRNLRRCFPEMSSTEEKKLLKKIYRNFSDILMESIKGFSLDPQEIAKRYKFKNTEILEKYYQNGQSVISVAGHLGNWEWAARCIDLSLQHLVVGIVKPINNTYIHNYVLNHRGGSKVVIEFIRGTKDAFEKYKKETSLYVLIADQSPVNMKTAHWVNFMNTMTPFLHGPASLSKKYNYPIVFMPVNRVDRGRYEIVIEELVNDPTDHSAEEITTIFAQAMEERIKAKPAQWLWTHRRWKRAHMYQP